MDAKGNPIPYRRLPGLPGSDWLRFQLDLAARQEHMHRERMQYSVSEPFADVTRREHGVIGQCRQAWIKQRMSELVRGRAKHPDLMKMRRDIKRRERRLDKLTTKARKLCARNQELTGEDALRVMASRMERYDMTHKFDYELAKIEAEEWRRNRDDLALLLRAGGDANARYKFEKNTNFAF